MVKPIGIEKVSPQGALEWHKLEEFIRRIALLYNFEEIRLESLDEESLKLLGHEKIAICDISTYKSFMFNQIIKNHKLIKEFSINSLGEFSSLKDIEMIAFGVTVMKSLGFNNISVKLKTHDLDDLNLNSICSSLESMNIKYDTFLNESDVSLEYEIYINNQEKKVAQGKRLSVSHMDKSMDITTLSFSLNNLLEIINKMNRQIAKRQELILVVESHDEASNKLANVIINKCRIAGISCDSSFNTNLKSRFKACISKDTITSDIIKILNNDTKTQESIKVDEIQLFISTILNKSHCKGCTAKEEK